MDHSAVLEDLFESVDARPKRKAAARTRPQEVLDRSIGISGQLSASGSRDDDRERLRELFGPGLNRGALNSPRMEASLATALELRPRPDSWPVHNYNEAYGDLERSRPVRRRARSQRKESDVWDIQEILEPESSKEGASGAVKQEPAELPPWPMHQRRADPLPGIAGPSMEPMGPLSSDPKEWLAGLAGEIEATTTEARLVRTLRGEPAVLRAPLFDTTEVLHAKSPAEVAVARKRAQAALSLQSPQEAPNLRSRLARHWKGPRALLFKAAALVLGLKVGATLGFFAAALL